MSKRHVDTEILSFIDNHQSIVCKSIQQANIELKNLKDAYETKKKELEDKIFNIQKELFIKPCGSTNLELTYAVSYMETIENVGRITGYYSSLRSAYSNDVSFSESIASKLPKDVVILDVEQISINKL